MNRVAVEGRVLAWACERAGYGTEGLASRFPQLPAWEAGTAQPTLRQLEQFARAVHVPAGYLFLREPPEEPVPIPDFRTLAGGAPRRPSPDLLDTIYLCQQRQDWYRDFARQVGEEPLAFVGSLRVAGDVVESANAVRAGDGQD